MEENRIREHYVFFGRVQGVGFRYRAKYVANGLRITGWVRNDWDGTVEMEVQGKESEIDQLIIFLQNQRFILIEDMKVKRLPVVDERDFYEK